MVIIKKTIVENNLKAKESKIKHHKKIFVNLL